MSETETPDRIESPVRRLMDELSREASTSPEEALCCFNCLHPVTREPLSITIMGRHVHFLVNPYGFQFHVRCFSDALGCISQGDLVDADSWFPGFYWRYALCAECQAQLGWHYMSDSGSSFYGLIADKLVINEHPE